LKVSGSSERNLIYTHCFKFCSPFYFYRSR